MRGLASTVGFGLHKTRFFPSLLPQPTRALGSGLYQKHFCCTRSNSPVPWRRQSLHPNRRPPPKHGACWRACCVSNARSSAIVHSPAPTVYAPVSSASKQSASDVGGFLSESCWRACGTMRACFGSITSSSILSTRLLQTVGFLVRMGETKSQTVLNLNVHFLIRILSCQKKRQQSNPNLRTRLSPGPFVKAPWHNSERLIM